MAAISKARLCHALSHGKVKYNQQESVLDIADQLREIRCSDFPSYESNQSSQARDRLSGKTFQEFCYDTLSYLLRSGEASAHPLNSKPLFMAGNKVWLACCCAA